MSPDQPLAIDGEPPDPFASEDLAEAAIKSAPAWLVSFVFHTVLIIVLAVLYVAQELPESIALNATYAETLGEQLDDDLLEASLISPMEVQDPVFSLDRLPADDPLARPPDIAPRLSGLTLTDPLPAPSIGVALSGREQGNKEALLAKYGGTATTQAAVERALEWLKRNQRRDGSWSLKGPYSDGSHQDNPTAATALALLAFQGDGHTNETGTYRDQVNRGCVRC